MPNARSEKLENSDMSYVSFVKINNNIILSHPTFSDFPKKLFFIFLWRSIVGIVWSQAMEKII